MSVQKPALAVVIFAVMIGGSAARGEDFYEGQLRAAAQDAAAGRLIDAADSYRIAAFGLLNRPTLLEESLVGLALVQSQGGQPDLARTLDRFVEVESRFHVYNVVNVTPDARRDLVDLLRRTLPASRLAAVPELAGPPPVEKGKRKKSAPANAAAVAPVDPLASARDAAARGDFRGSERAATKAIEAAPANRDAYAVRAHARVAMQHYKDALEDFNHVTPDMIDADSTLLADLFVAYVGEQHWTSAEVLRGRLTEGARVRSDVRAALRVPIPVSGVKR